MKIKNVIFDLGKVLIDYDFSGFWKNIGCKEERFLDEAEKPILLFESGKIIRTAFISELKKVYNFDISQEEFEKYWCEVFFEIPEMIDLARKVSEKYETYILSNTDELHFPYIWQRFPSLHFFKKENLMLSYEMNAVKPDQEIYIKAFEDFEIIPQESVFIDDRPINVHTAANFDMKGIIHRKITSTIDELGKMIEI